MNLILADLQQHLEFAPLSLTRPLGELRVGILTNTQRWQFLLPDAAIYFRTEAYLQEKFPDATDGILINACIIANPDFAAIVSALEPGQALYCGSQWMASYGQENERLNYSGEHLIILEKRWDMYVKNAQILSADFEMVCAGRRSAALSKSNTLIGPLDKLFIEEGAKVEASVLNTSTGPIYIGKDAEIMEGCLVRGALALLDGAVLKMGAKLYGATTIGPECRVGGEVSNCVFQGYANKGHDGFLGNALIGEWCNLGADTNCSNLKNNYSSVRTYSYATQTEVESAQQFMGISMGDHSKTAINTMFNTASVIGVSVNVVSSGFPAKYLPSFTWLQNDECRPFELSKAIEAAKAMMQRRHVSFTEAELHIFEHLAKD
ncbi:MAG: hypothetical protein RLZZ301_1239 [Bacteroidota bacterium]|jgi:UDP-N-acetylglucosamine diphosphorylase/glucosamine-1-phosphate N-acetyltransferase